MTDSARLTRKQHACHHEHVKRVTYANDWGFVCEDCSLRFSPHPLLVGARRELEDALIRERYWQEMVGNADHNTAAVRDQLTKEIVETRNELTRSLDDARNELIRKNLEVQDARRDRDAAKRDAEVERNHRIRETSFLRGLVIRAVEIVQE